MALYVVFLIYVECSVVCIAEKFSACIHILLQATALIREIRWAYMFSWQRDTLNRMIRICTQTEYHIFWMNKMNNTSKRRCSFGDEGPYFSFTSTFFFLMSSCGVILSIFRVKSKMSFEKFRCIFNYYASENILAN